MASHGHEDRARPPWWRESLLLGTGYLVYEMLRIAAASSTAAAYRDAGYLLDFERTAHLDFEASWNAWLSAQDRVSDVAGYYYVIAHFGVVTAMLLWLYLRRPREYPYLRNVLALSSFLALAVFWLFPVAPPRLASAAFTDTVAIDHVLGATDSHSAQGWVNLYAAMPSLHVGWALWAALAVSVAAAHRSRHLAWIYPALTGIVVIATGNHYVLDVVAALALVLGCAAVCRARSGIGAPVAAMLGRLRSRLPTRRERFRASDGRVVGSVREDG